MIHTQKDIKSLNQRALGITPPTVLMPFSLALTDIVKDAIRQPSRSHILAPSQKRTQLMKEDRRVTLLMHPLQHSIEVLNTVSESAKQWSQTCRVMGRSCRNCIEHQWYKAGTFGLDGDGDDDEPFFVFCSGKSGEEGDVVWVCDVCFWCCGVVPECETCKCCAWG